MRVAEQKTTPISEVEKYVIFESRATKWPLAEASFFEPQARNSHSFLMKERGLNQEQALEHRNISKVAPQSKQREREQELVTRAQQGDGNAFGELCQIHSTHMFRTALRITNNHEDAEDALQSAHLSAFKHISSFKHHSLYRTWITRIVTNSALMILRRKRYCREIALEPHWHEDNAVSQPFAGSTDKSPEKLYQSKESREWLSLKTCSLTPPIRAVLDLYLRDEFSIREIAGRLKISESAVKSRLRRARGLLAAKAAQAQLREERK